MSQDKFPFSTLKTTSPKSYFSFALQKFSFCFLLCFLTIAFTIHFNFHQLLNLFGNTNEQNKHKLIQEIEELGNETPIPKTESLQMAILFQNTIREIASKTSKAVVHIRSRYTQQPRDYNDFLKFFFGNPFENQKRKYPQNNSKTIGIGSGFVISPKGYIVTNQHVLKSENGLTVSFPDENKEYMVDVIGQDSNTDLAVIKVKSNRKNFPYIPMGDSDNVEVGDFAIAIGNPFNLRGTLTFGVISAKGRGDEVAFKDKYKNYIQTDAYINRGNSGGPLLNIQGKVIGVNTAILAELHGQSLGIGFAIPINFVKKVIKSLITEGFVQKGYLGIQIKNLDRKMVEYFKTKGVLITYVEPNGPSSKAGIKTGDIIVGFNKKKITKEKDIQTILIGTKKGQSCKLTVLRNGRKLSFNVILSKAKEGKKHYQGKKINFLGMVLTENQENNKIKGVSVLEIKKNSMARMAGLQTGDIIQSINYKKINNLSDMSKYVAKNKSKSSHFIQVKRRISLSSDSPYSNIFFLIKQG